MKHKISPPTNGNECRFREDAARHFTGEIFLTGFENHLKDCPSCQEVGDVLQRLRSLSAAEPSSALSANILAAIQQPETEPLRYSFHRWAAAAIVVISLTSVIFWQNQKKSDQLTAQIIPTPTISENSDRSVQEALDWFCRNQEDDGSWSPERWGGDPRFEVALTALPLLALLSAETESNPQRDQAIDQAKQYLLANCDTRGRFGPQFFGSSYSQGIATLALLTCYKNQPDEETRSHLDHALAVIMSQQHESGFWGSGGSAQPDVTITRWQLKALKMASELGWKEVHPHLSLGTKWEAAHAQNTSPAVAALSPKGAVDYFTVYFATTRLKEAGDETSRDQLTSIRHTLRCKQVLSGDDSGSWTPDDRWGQAGGRLYTTALASLSLH
jgi:hypothetical protein